MDCKCCTVDVTVNMYFGAILEQNHLSVLVMDMLDSLTMENMYFRLI